MRQRKGKNIAKKCNKNNELALLFIFKKYNENNELQYKLNYIFF